MCLLNRLVIIILPCFCLGKEGLTDRKERITSVCQVKEVLTGRRRRKHISRGRMRGETGDKGWIEKYTEGGR